MVYAFIGAVLIGVSLGLLGSGGSILTVPVLVYLLHRPEKAAIAESLAIVGGIALIGVAQYAWRRQTRWAYVLAFGVPGMGGAFLGALAARQVSGALQLAVFALVMLAAAWAMLRG
ncbi:MAG TPA: sulfite exporter TauE/SafE family protein, partial [Phycisphaerales bacterium]|nr:sulfite exporter TauE/SafE family protein [Phycisphaerales bacterium]